MVSVSRGAGVPAGFFACVADGAESIARTSAKAAAGAAEQLHCTPKGGAAGNDGRGQVSGKEFSELVAGQERRERLKAGAASGPRNIPLDNSRYNMYYAVVRPG